MDRLQVSEIFYSLQGEGPFIGRPFVFLRLGGCIPPYCPFCDTKYAWKDFRSISVFDIFEEVLKYRCKKVVITGGEPFLQWKHGLEKLTNMFFKDSFFIQYETSGKVEIPEEHKGQVVCSPKYLHGRWHISEDNLIRCDYFKFVASKSNFSHILEFIHSKNIDKNKIYIMPLGATREEQLKNMGFVFDFCREHGFNMTPRLHILCYGNKQGI